MEYKSASVDNLENVFAVVQETIKAIYPKYYPREVVEFFLELHSLDNIRGDIEKGTVGILTDSGKILGTGCYEDDHITRVYVLPEHQGKGYGSFIMNKLEEIISLKYNKAVLDASLPGSGMYLNRGYKTTEHCTYKCVNDVVLYYDIMEKELQVL